LKYFQLFSKTLI